MQHTILEKPIEVEELVKLGTKWSMCPYYATRNSHALADVVLMPYSTLLSEDIRESFGIDLKGSVVVVDEAHNLVDAINSVHSAVVTEKQLSTAYHQLTSYQQRFRSRLGPGNLCNIDTLLMVASRLLEVFKGAPAGAGHTPAGGAQVMGVNDFLFRFGMDHVNLFQLLQYVRESKVRRRCTSSCPTPSVYPCLTVMGLLWIGRWPSRSLGTLTPWPTLLWARWS
jgi:chromosome transmission fidelity protein 1